MLNKTNTTIFSVEEEIVETLNDVVTHSDNKYYSHEVEMLHEIKQGMREEALDADMRGEDIQDCLIGMIEFKEAILDKKPIMEIMDKWESYIPILI